MQAVPWGETTPDGAAIGAVCFRCADIVGRIRPAVKLADAPQMLQKPPANDPAFPGDYRAAMEALEDPEGTSFLPSSGVCREQTFGCSSFKTMAQ